ncbi:RAMP superfamily CRISPR-associated protein [Cronbergia sp. UHCC 0137]|uniref:RAMP superfamily CRISPR-associated protein n=1 Tax=Cronbergia sp. UHCC 0137 TaxID=3110239 RepID=UPI002B212F4C|nr:RAMP superfamily CRISPR-associated protein [Cronbergia sp. UHCC 0137]MEA5620470.1 RAMP superfamily CRISPR-associated protein [Cronbergia sp. UHCC 0137]
MNAEDIPMMFRAQIDGRCQIHRVINKKESAEKRQDAEIWVDEWKNIFPKDLLPKEVSYSNQAASNQPVNKALARSKPSVKPAKNINFKFPEFGSHVETWKYTIKWRLVSNSGQDEGFIRPIIGAKGFPYFSGASMKGAFIRACKQLYGKEQGRIEAENYCGKKLENGSSEPGILRFHGAYPVDLDWTTKLVDIVHSQESRQVIKDDRDKSTNANSMISLYHTTLKFGFSSSEELDNPAWDKIKKIWEIALANGLGSRVSAGYGYFQETDYNQQKPSHLLLQIKLKGQGGVSTLVNKTPEFRPNMFKAALRGHTLRLLAGMTDEVTAKEITKKLWGGFADKNNQNSKDVNVGLLGIGFDFNLENFSFPSHPKHYELSQGILNIFCMHPDINDAERLKLIDTAKAIIKFAILFGGIGKSWRRVCHKEFYTTYFERHPEKVIGCHWQFIDESEYYPINNLENDQNNTKNPNDIAKYIQQIRDVIRSWIPQDKQIKRDVNLLTNKPTQKSTNTTVTTNIPNNKQTSKPNQAPVLKSPPKRPETVQNQPQNQSNKNDDITQWREAWYAPKVQVWARFAENSKSLAIHWFHDAYKGNNRIRNPYILAGSMGNTGRIWHRMYPRFVTNEQGKVVSGKGYVELLTIFPDECSETKKFLDFLKDESEFKQVW